MQRQDHRGVQSLTMGIPENPPDRSNSLEFGGDPRHNYKEGNDMVPEKGKENPANPRGRNGGDIVAKEERT